MVLERLNPTAVIGDLQKVEEADLAEMWSYVGNKEHPRWLWHAIDHVSGKVLAYVMGDHKDCVFVKLKALLEPFEITRFYTDDWGAYERHLWPESHMIGKRNTQRIERKHLTLRTRIKRLVRKTICFSKLEKMHDIVIGLFVNRYEFGLLV
ncbi:MAG TPA: IS1 family transposase [Saprospiraceae bacterium]|nr:IS1 family transposase [Saprospiraceae bacterium]